MKPFPYVFNTLVVLAAAATVVLLMAQSSSYNNPPLSPPADTAMPPGGGGSRAVVAQVAFMQARKIAASDPSVLAALKAANAAMRAAMVKSNPSLNAIFNANPNLANNLVVFANVPNAWRSAPGVVGPAGPNGNQPPVPPNLTQPPGPNGAPSPGVGTSVAPPPAGG